MPGSRHARFARPARPREVPKDTGCMRRVRPRPGSWTRPAGVGPPSTLRSAATGGTTRKGRGRRATGPRPHGDLAARRVLGGAGSSYAGAGASRPRRRGSRRPWLRRLAPSVGPGHAARAAPGASGVPGAHRLPARAPHSGPPAAAGDAARPCRGGGRGADRPNRHGRMPSARRKGSCEPPSGHPLGWTPDPAPIGSGHPPEAPHAPRPHRRVPPRPAPAPPADALRHEPPTRPQAPGTRETAGREAMPGGRRPIERR